MAWRHPRKLGLYQLSTISLGSYGGLIKWFAVADGRPFERLAVAVDLEAPAQLPIASWIRANTAYWWVWLINLTARIAGPS